MVGPDFERPAPAVHPVAFEIGQYTLPGETVATSFDDTWWTLFNDTTLNALQAQLQKDSLDLEAATARIAQSRAQAGIAAAASLPRLGMNGSYAREANSANGPLAMLGAPDDPHNLWQGGFDAGWEIDLWGTARRQQESAGARLETSIYAKEAIRVMLAAELTRHYLLLRGTQTQLDIAHKNHAIAENVLRLTRSRVHNGVATRFETASSQAQLATINALIPALTQQQNAQMNAIALLLGQPPRALDSLLAPSAALPRLPAKVPVGLPSELVQRRPDIRQSEAALHAAIAAIGMAQADFYPRIQLTGRLGLQALDSNDLGNWSSRTFSVGPTFYLPIFEGGRLKSNLALSEARARESAISYQKTVLTAWHEVANALDIYAAEQLRQQEQNAAVNHQQEAYKVALHRYEEGAADYLNVLTSQRALLVSQLELANTTTRITLSMVDLYKALGGGWNTAVSNQAAVSEQKQDSSPAREAVHHAGEGA